MICEVFIIWEVGGGFWNDRELADLKQETAIKGIDRKQVMNDMGPVCIWEFPQVLMDLPPPHSDVYLLGGGAGPGHINR